MKKQAFVSDNQFKLFVQRPENIDLDALLQNNPPEFTYKRDGFLYLFDLYIDHYSWRESKEILNAQGYVPLNSQKLKLIIHNYQKYVNYLVQTGIWEKVDSYLVGEYSKSYRFVKKYNTPYVNDEITNLKLIAKILGQKHEENQRIVEQYPGIVEWFNGLEIDSIGSLKFIDDYIQEITSQKKTLRKKDRKKLAQKKSSYIRSVMKIANKDYSFKIDPKSGRLFSVLTNMKKELRHYLSYNGKKLVCVDLSNSQPLFSLLLLNIKFYDMDCHTSDIINLSVLPKYIQNNMNKKSSILSGTIKMMRRYIYNNMLSDPTIYYDGIEVKDVDKLLFLPKCGKMGDFEGQDFNKLHDAAEYCFNVRNGKLYENFKSAMKSEEDVKIVKKGLLSMLFADPNDNRDYFRKYRVAFNKQYPNIDKLFNEIKQNDHSLLSYILQSIEAEVFLNRICKRIKEENSSIPLFTIHDSITTTEDNVQYITKIINEEIIKAVEVKPNLKKEFWNITV